MTGCSSSPSASRYTKVEKQTIEPTPAASKQPTQTETAQLDKQADATSVEPTQQIEKAQEQLPEKTSAPTTKPTNKPTKSQKVQEAKKSNESLGKAVTDSIMNNNKDKSAVKAPEAIELKKSIEQIRALIKELKQHAETEDTTNMKNVSLQIVKNWEEIKKDVAVSYPDMVEFLQDKIVKLNELQAVETIDSQALLPLDYELYQAFRQLAEKTGL
ncbi:unnamed protein product [Aphanomyces euteiches]